MNKYADHSTKNMQDSALNLNATSTHL